MQHREPPKHVTAFEVYYAIEADYTLEKLHQSCTRVEPRFQELCGKVRVDHKKFIISPNVPKDKIQAIMTENSFS